MRPIKNDFPTALKRARKFTGRSQEEFGLISSRTYVSLLERGLRSPTLSKVDTLAEVLELHPLTVLSLAYLGHKTRDANERTLAQVMAEVLEVLDFVAQGASTSNGSQISRP